MVETRKNASRILLYTNCEEVRQEAAVLLANEGTLCICVDNRTDLLQLCGQDLKAIVLDASDYGEDYLTLLEEIRNACDSAVLVVMLPDDSGSYRSHMQDAGADVVFSVENLKEELFSAVHQTPIWKKEEEIMKKQGKDMHGIPVSRRTFLKGSAAATVLAGASAMFGCGTTDTLDTTEGSSEVIPESTPEAPVVLPEVKEEVYCGACRGNCAGGCFLNIHVRDGKVVRTSARDLPDTRYNRICIKGLTHTDRMYSNDRLKYPLRRVGERGAGQWEQISWEEAIKEIADKWKGYQAEFGTQSVGIYVGSGNYATCSGEGLGCGTTRLMNTIGAANISASVDMARGTGANPVVGTGALVTGNEAADLLNAKTILCWGSNPVNSQQQVTHFMLEAQEQGTKLVVIDPTFTATAAKADMFVPIRPGTDAVLAMAMMNIILRDDLVDWDFVYNHTDAPMLIKATDGKYLRLSDIRALAEGEKDAPVVMGEDGKVDIPANVTKPVITGAFEVNGISVTCAFDLLKASVSMYTPEKAAEICNLPVSQIEEVAKLHATNKPSTTYLYYGVDHYVNGHYGFRAITMLAALTGNLGKPGAFCGMNESLGTNFANIVGAGYPAGGTVSPISIPILWMPEILESGKFGEKDITLKSMYVAHANVIGNSAERKSVIDTLNKIEFIVMADLNMNETAQYADILLPAAHWFEVDDIFMNYSTHPYVLLQEKAVEPPYECKSDYQIYREIATAMGYPDTFAMDEFEYMKLWLDTDGARAVGLTYEEVMDKKAVRFVKEGFVFAEGGVFGTTTGRAQFYNEAPKPAMMYGQEWNPDHERLPFWEPPHEAWHENPLHEKYPFNLLNIHPKWRTHSQWWDVPMLEEISGKPALHMNPEDAKKKGIKEGDNVKIFNDRGYVVMPATLNGGIQPGTVAVPKGWEKGQFIDGHYQDLTSRVMHPMINNSAFFDALCDVEKV